MEIKKFYRVGTTDTTQGLWYTPNGEFTGDIHTKYNFCKCNELQMPYDKEIIGWISVTDTIHDLYNWFPVEDILTLQELGFAIHEYESSEYKMHNGHYVIKQDTAILIGKIYQYGW